MSHTLEESLLPVQEPLVGLHWVLLLQHRCTSSLAPRAGLGDVCQTSNRGFRGWTP